MEISKDLATSAQVGNFTNSKVFHDVLEVFFHNVTRMLTPLTLQNADVALQFYEVCAVRTICEWQAEKHLTQVNPTSVIEVCSICSSLLVFCKFVCYLYYSTSNYMISSSIWNEQALVIFSMTTARVILLAFEKITPGYLFQLALEIMWLHVQYLIFSTFHFVKDFSFVKV